MGQPEALAGDWKLGDEGRRSETSRPDSGLRGRLDEFSPFDILQVLLFLRRSGRLEFRRPDGLEAECALRDGRVVEAECGHLTGCEALLTLLWWVSGEFRFDSKATVATSVALGTEALMMDAVRLADEIELRAAWLPRSELPLRLEGGAALPEDPFGCGLGQVFEYLSGHPGVSRSAIENAMPLCPIKIRLALILLRPQLALESGVAPQQELATAASRWWKEICQRKPGGLRVLVAFAASGAFADIDRAVNALGRALDVPMTATAVSAQGPSFVRFRPPQGGVLSLTFLPITPKHRYLLETFAGSMAAVLFSGWASAGSEAEIWTSMVPQGVGFQVLDETRNLADELPAALLRLAEHGVDDEGTVVEFER